jgi:apoptosis-inducing factor 3
MRKGMPTIEAAVAHVDDLQDGEKQPVKAGETEVLLIRQNGRYFAIAAHCTHYQAPLAEGVLSGDCIICPWHNAYFNITTGDQQEPPGLDSLMRYEVRIDGDKVIVLVPEEAALTRTRPMAKYDANRDQRTFVILGAGAAGAHTAETLRIENFQGRIIMATQDDRLPYDRTSLSKDYFNGEVTREQMPLRSSEFYREHDIEVWLNKSAAHVDAQTKTIQFTDGDTLSYDALLLATGGKPRLLEVPGAALQNVLTLRSFSDCDRILKAAQTADRAVVIGSSFIGMEIAAGLTQQGVRVTVVSPESVPFEKTLGHEIGSIFQQVHEEQGVLFQLGRKVDRLEGNSKVEAAILDNGDRLPTDLVIVGIGVQPATEFVNGVERYTKDHSILVNDYLQAADGLYAAGDIARYPDWRTGESTRVEHWRIAAQQGRTAAYNMVGKLAKFRAVPVFWTMQFKFPLRYVGHAEQWDELVVDGDLQKRQFIAFYVKDNQVLAAATSQRDTETAAISELMRLGQMPTPEQLRSGINVVEYLAQPNVCS